MDLSKYPNPYDFANPVKDPSVFSGRARILKDIDYYIDNSVKSNRSISLAIIGDRASGKTSILNMIDVKCKEKKIIPVRIDLDEGDAVSPLFFFYKLMDNLITDICSNGFYEGVNGKTYQTYRSIVDSFVIPEDLTFCPFVFPIQYANCMRKNSDIVNISENIIKRDLICLKNEVNAQISLIFDECDVLSQNRIILQKIRNIFMNTEGYFLVLTGTDTLFPIINDIFSPIIRQFKKIDILPFDDEEETRDCIERPLKKHKLNPSEVFDFETLRDVQELHNISGGRPYEIQLICHFLFKRVQEGLTHKMTLDIDVLDDVLHELHSIYDPNKRPIIQKIKGMDEKVMNCLSSFCFSEGEMTYDQASFRESIFSKREHNEEEFFSIYKKLIEEGVLISNDEKISFKGDEFDKIYCKYYARKKHISLMIIKFPYLLSLGVKLNTYLKLNNLEMGNFVRFKASLKDPHEDIELIENWENNKKEFIKYLLEEIEDNIYFLLYDSSETNCNMIVLLYYNINTPWGSISCWLHKTDIKEVDDLNKFMDNLENITQDLKERFVAQNGSLFVSVVKGLCVSKDDLVDYLLSTEKTKLINSIVMEHHGRMYKAHTKDHDLECAIKHMEMCMKLQRTPSHMNNYAYLLIRKGEIKKAEELITCALEIASLSDDKIILLYNQGIINLLQNKYIDARNNFIAAKILSDQSQEIPGFSCLYLPIFSVGKVELDEIFDPDINLFIDTIIENIDKATI